MIRQSEISGRYVQSYLYVVPIALAALLIVSFFVAIYFIVTFELFGVLMFPVFMFATVLYGLIPAVTLGAGVYALYLVKPKFGLYAVFLVSLVPGILFVWMTEPELNRSLWFGAGPVFALVLHGLVRADARRPGR